MAPNVLEPTERPKTIAGNAPRFLHVDALRGALLVMMAVNHIPSDLQIATNHVFGFVSAAEGFVFLSGLMSGLVYARKYYKAGPAEVKESAVRRASSIYVYHVITYLLVLLGVQLCSAWTGTAPTIAPSIMLDHPIQAFFAGITLLQQPSLFDILPMYCVLLLTVPVVVLACSKGHRSAVLTTSALLWLLANAFSPQTPLIHGAVNTGSFNFLGWQLLFVVGTVFGHAWAVGQRLWPKPHSGLVLVTLVLAGILYAARHSFIQLPISEAALSWLTNKNNVAPLRLLDTALLYYLVYTVAARFPQLLSWKACAFVGQHSMFAFAAHILVAYALQAFPQIFVETIGGRALGSVIMVGSLFAAAAFHQNFQERAKRRSREIDARQGWLATPKMGHES